MIDDQHGGGGIEHGGVAGALGREAAGIDQDISEEHVPSEARLGEDHDDFDAHGRDEEGLMDGGADAEDPRA